MNPTDICGIHDYTLRPGDYEVKYQQMEDVLNYHAQGRMLFAMPEAYQGQPVMLTEFGGITYTDEPGETFGYLEPVVSGEAFFERFAAIVRAVRRDPSICGFCYTQLTDVMQERNGLLNADREAKVDVRRINKVLNGIVER